MQEVRYDGSEQLTRNPTADQLQKAIDNPSNKTVMLHGVGSIITMQDGKRYRVHKDGSWRKI